MKKNYQFQFSKNAERDFSTLEKSLQKRILKKLEFFEKNKNPLLSAKKLSGFENKYSFRIGDYRIIVTPKSRQIFVILLVLKIGHRREIYGES